MNTTLSNLEALLTFKNHLCLELMAALAPIAEKNPAADNALQELQRCSELIDGQHPLTTQEDLTTFSLHVTAMNNKYEKGFIGIAYPATVEAVYTALQLIGEYGATLPNLPRLQLWLDDNPRT